jgi:hypothetical protein
MQQRMEREFFRTQPQLTENEIPYGVYVLMETVKDPNAQVEENMKNYATQFGISHDRLLYVVTKVSTGIVIAADPSLRQLTLEQVGFAEALPTEKELELIKSKMNEIMKTMSQPQ